MGPTGEEDWQAYRRRMLAETEQFIEWGLRHPEQVDWIPIKPIGEGAFPRKVADWFYQTIFAGDGDEGAGFWRRKLRMRIRRR